MYVITVSQISQVSLLPGTSFTGFNIAGNKLSRVLGVRLKQRGRGRGFAMICENQFKFSQFDFFGPLFGLGK